MKKKLFKLFKNEHKAYGGLFFIITTSICAVLLSLTLEMASASQAQAISSEIAHLIAIEGCSYCFNQNNAQKNIPNNTKLSPASSIASIITGFNPDNRFKELIEAAGISRLNTYTSTGTSGSYFIWNRNTRTFTFKSGYFTTPFGTKVSASVKKASIYVN